MAHAGKLFSKEAIERSLSPDNLERLMPVASAKDWLMIVASGTLLVLFAVWAVAGRVPTIVAGRGVILRPRQVMQIQTVNAGRVLTMRWRAGDRIEKGDIAATMDQPELRKRVEEDRRHLGALEEQDRNKSEAENRERDAQTRQDGMERAGLEAERATLRKSLADANTLQPILEDRVEANRKMIKEGLLGVASREVSDAESAVRDTKAKINDYNSRLSQTDGRLQQIETRGSNLTRQFLEASTGRRNEIAQIRRAIEIGEFQLRQDGTIYSQYSGRVAELMVAPGQVLAAGGRLMTVDADESQPALLSISYFQVRDGKRIQPGMRIQVTPDTVERERFGGIEGRVTSVSPIPVTKEGATGIIGNPEVVQSLMPDGAYIEVRARLETDPRTFSGFRWSSSRGPEIKLTSGLTHSTRVTVEGRAPVTYFIPMLRETAGVY